MKFASLKRQHPATYLVEEVLDMEERRNGNGRLTWLLRGERSYSVTGGRAVRVDKVKSECVSWEINELVKITRYIRLLGTH